jgi:hypothetical protein
MGSGVVMYITGFINISSGIQKIIGRDSHSQDGDLISRLLFFRNKGSTLKTLAVVSVIGSLDPCTFAPTLAVGFDHRVTGPLHFRTDAF